MILQVDKFKKEDVGPGKNAHLCKDFYDKVKETKQQIGFTQVFFEDSTMKSFSRLQEDPGGVWVYSQGWLLNDEGKTIQRLF